MSLADHVKSTKNLDLIRAFARKKLEFDWPKADLTKAIDLCLLDSIDSVIDTYNSWAVSATNIAEINVHVWRVLRQNVIHSLKGAQVHPEEAINRMFESGAASRTDSRDQNSREPKSDGIISEHGNEALKERYLEAWRSKYE